MWPESAVLFYAVYICGCSCSRLARAEREVDEALAGERDDNSWNWVKRKLGGVRGYSIFFEKLIFKLSRSVATGTSLGFEPSLLSTKFLFAIVTSIQI